MKKDWIWMPHAGHFICGPRCEFKLNTYVNGFIISTVGDLPSFDVIGGWEELGADNRTHETMVFRAKKSERKCCPYTMTKPRELEMRAYKTADAAYAGHLAMCEKYDKIKKGKK